MPVELVVLFGFGELGSLVIAATVVCGYREAALVALSFLFRAVVSFLSLSLKKRVRFAGVMVVVGSVLIVDWRSVVDWIVVVVCYVCLGDWWVGCHCSIRAPYGLALVV